MNNESLRLQVRLLKATQGISYKELSEYAEMKQYSFYQWLQEKYDLSYTKQKKLSEILNALQQGR